VSRLPIRLLTLALAAVNAPLRRAPSASQPVRRVLVAHNLLFGDTLLLATLLAKLAARYPDAERIVLARPAVAPLFSGNPYGFRALAYDPSNFKSFRALFGHGPIDLAYVLGDNRYSWLARAAGARWIIGFENDRPAWKNWMVDELRPHPTSPTAWADMAASLVDGEAPQLFCPGDWPAPQAPRLEIPSGEYAVLHVGASTPLKLWPADRWRAVAKILFKQNITPVWSTGHGEAELIEEIDPERRYPRYCGTLSLPQLWHLLAGARILVCPDTGVAHLGKVVGIPTIVLYGPGSSFIYGKGEFWRNAPNIGVAEDPFPCRDQKRLFRREINWVRRCGRSPTSCPTPGACMQAISFSSVESAIGLLLNGSHFAENDNP
jgi:ADP-heptose:LPS heptosyltransferase